MAKKKTSKPKPASKAATPGMPAGLHAMRDLQKLLGEQNFQTQAEIEAFMNKVMEEGIPEFEPDGVEEDAEALLEEAMGKTPEEAVKLARKALELDTECIAAYAILADCEEFIPIRAALFKRGVDIGIDRFSGAYMDENRGHFWGLVETRPYMRCMYGYAESLFDMGQMANALYIWLEMLELNASDNLGVREQAMLVLAALGDEEDFAEVDDNYADDDMCGTLYNRVLMAYNQTKPDLKKAASLLQAAIKRNPHVPGLLISGDDPPMNDGPYTLGSVEEALTYTQFAWPVWMVVPGALDWLEERIQTKMRKV